MTVDDLVKKIDNLKLAIVHVQATPKEWLNERTVNYYFDKFVEDIKESIELLLNGRK